MKIIVTGEKSPKFQNLVRGLQNLTDEHEIHYADAATALRQKDADLFICAHRFNDDAVQPDYLIDKIDYTRSVTTLAVAIDEEWNSVQRIKEETSADFVAPFSLDEATALKLLETINGIADQIPTINKNKKNRKKQIPPSVPAESKSRVQEAEENIDKARRAILFTTVAHLGFNGQKTDIELNLVDCFTLSTLLDKNGRGRITSLEITAQFNAQDDLPNIIQSQTERSILKLKKKLQALFDESAAPYEVADILTATKGGNIKTPGYAFSPTITRQIEIHPVAEQNLETLEA